LEIPEKLQRIGPGFESAAFEAEKGESPADLVEGRLGLGEAPQGELSRSDLESGHRSIDR